MMTDEQREADGCFTRTEADAAGCMGLSKGCHELIPESEYGKIQIADADLVACLKASPIPKRLYESLYDFFREQEVDRRLDNLNPAERDAVRDQIVPTDAWCPVSCPSGTGYIQHACLVAIP